MKTQSNNLFERLRSGTNSKDHPSGVTSRQMCTEAEFTNQVRLERRRAERSRKPFLLMLLAQKAPEERNGRERYIDKVASAVSASIRETDAIGWYESSRIIGVIFTEIASASQEII